MPVDYLDDKRRKKKARAKVINFRNPADNRFLVVRELKVQGLRSPHDNRRADLVCYVNGPPLVFVELKNVWTNIRNGFDQDLDLNDAIAEKIEEANLDDDEMAKIEKLLGKSYEVITAGERLDKVADDFVQHCSARWETGKMMLVCIDEVTATNRSRRYRRAQGTAQDRQRGDWNGRPR